MMPPLKSRLSITVDSELANWLEEDWRESRKQAALSYDAIPSFSQYIESILRRYKISKVKSFQDH